MERAGDELPSPPRASLEELVAGIEARNAELRQRAELLQARAQALQDLRAQMTAGVELFDREDIAVVDAELNRNHMETAAVQQELQTQTRRKEQACAIFAEAMKTLEQRTALLESADASSMVLRDNPELCQALARKQVQLQRLLQTRFQEWRVAPATSTNTSH